MTFNAMAVVPLVTLLCYIPLLGIYLRSRRRSRAHAAFVSHLSLLVLRSFGSFLGEANRGSSDGHDPALANVRLALKMMGGAAKAQEWR